MRDEQRGAGGVRVTSYDVARAAGVSQSTVSRAFDPSAPIKKGLRERVVIAARELGWQPNTIARSLQQRRTDLVGVVTAELDTPWRAHQMAALVPALQDAGLRPLLFQAPDHSDVEELVAELASYQGRAVVIGAGQISTTLAGRFASQGILVIIVNRWMPSSGVLSLGCDNEAGGRLAARHMLEQGCRRFALLRYRPSVSGADRLRGFVEEVGKEAASFDFVEVEGMTRQAGHSGGRQLAARLGSFDGVFCANDALALGLMDFAYDVPSFAVGRDFALMGFDGLPESAVAAYQLTTIVQPLGEIVETVAEWLAHWKKGGVSVNAADSRRLMPKLEERKSTLAFQSGIKC